VHNEAGLGDTHGWPAYVGQTRTSYLATFAEIRFIFRQFNHSFYFSKLEALVPLVDLWDVFFPGGKGKKKSLSKGTERDLLAMHSHPRTRIRGHLLQALPEAYAFANRFLLLCDYITVKPSVA
jgi:hypothetical protein